MARVSGALNMRPFVAAAMTKHGMLPKRGTGPVFHRSEVKLDQRPKVPSRRCGWTCRSTRRKRYGRTLALRLDLPRNTRRGKSGAFSAAKSRVHSQEHAFFVILGSLAKHLSTRQSSDGIGHLGFCILESAFFFFQASACSMSDMSSDTSRVQVCNVRLKGTNPEKRCGRTCRGCACPAHFLRRCGWNCRK